MDDAERRALLPCPFCGGEASDTGHTRYSRQLSGTWWEDGSKITECFFVNCIRCGAVSRGGLGGGYQTKAQAIAAWNRRDTPPAVGGWLTIESAPKDGNPFLATDGRHVEMAHYSERVQTYVITNMGWIFEPTHWQPLPAAPQPREETKG